MLRAVLLRKAALFFVKHKWQPGRVSPPPGRKLFCRTSSVTRFLTSRFRIFLITILLVKVLFDLVTKSSDGENLNKLMLSSQNLACLQEVKKEPSSEGSNDEA